MQISFTDLAIILSYFAVIIGLGMLVSRHRIKDINGYFLGSNALPGGTSWTSLSAPAVTDVPELSPGIVSNASINLQGQTNDTTRIRQEPQSARRCA